VSSFIYTEESRIIRGSGGGKITKRWGFSAVYCFFWYSFDTGWLLRLKKILSTDSQEYTQKTVLFSLPLAKPHGTLFSASR